jgi:hypothetical protein
LQFFPQPESPLKTILNTDISIVFKYYTHTDNISYVQTRLKNWFHAFVRKCFLNAVAMVWALSIKKLQPVRVLAVSRTINKYRRCL